MITLDFTPTEEERIASVARRSGLDTTDYVKKLVRENLPPEPTNAPPAVSEGNAAAIALLESWMAKRPPTTPRRYARQTPRFRNSWKT